MCFVLFPLKLNHQVLSTSGSELCFPTEQGEFLFSMKKTSFTSPFFIFGNSSLWHQSSWGTCVSYRTQKTTGVKGPWIDFFKNSFSNWWEMQPKILFSDLMWPNRLQLWQLQSPWAHASMCTAFPSPTWQTHNVDTGALTLQVPIVALQMAELWQLLPEHQGKVMIRTLANS